MAHSACGWAENETENDRTEADQADRPRKPLPTPERPGVRGSQGTLDVGLRVNSAADSRFPPLRDLDIPFDDRHAAFLKGDQPVERAWRDALIPLCIVRVRELTGPPRNHGLEAPLRWVVDDLRLYGVVNRLYFVARRAERTVFIAEVTIVVALVRARRC